LLTSVRMMTDDLHKTTKTAKKSFCLLFLCNTSTLSIHDDCSENFRELMEMFKSNIFQQGFYDKHNGTTR